MRFTDMHGRPGLDQDCLARCEHLDACLVMGCRRTRVDNDVDPVETIDATRLADIVERVERAGFSGVNALTGTQTIKRVSNIVTNAKEME